MFPLSCTATLKSHLKSRQLKKYLIIQEMMIYINVKDFYEFGHQVITIEIIIINNIVFVVICFDFQIRLK